LTYSGGESSCRGQSPDRRSILPGQSVGFIGRQAGRRAGRAAPRLTAHTKDAVPALKPEARTHKAGRPGLPASPPACRLGELRHPGIRGRPDDTENQDAMVPSIRDAMQST